MDKTLFEQLLFQEESDSLDFKRDQYPFDGATDEVKSELLKDILAFANSWKRTDGYILIGVEDVKGGKSSVVGIVDDLDDAKLQQFVNSKTNRPVSFAYESAVFDASRVGIIRLGQQQKPIYLTKDYGKLRKNEVYIRRGSSTDIAKPDEVALMGINSVELQKPSVELEFSDQNSKEKLGRNIKLNSLLLNYDKSNIRRFGSGFSPFSPSSLYENPNYYLEKAEYIKQAALVKKIGFWIKNTSEVHLSNVSLKIQIKCEPHIIIKDEVDYPRYPSKDTYNFAANLNFKPNSLIKKNRIDVSFENKKTNQTSLISADFGDIRPKEEIWSSDFFCIGATENYELKIEGQIFAHNLPEPLIVPLSIVFEVNDKDLDTEKLYR
jgi:hypothetical protein